MKNILITGGSRGIGRGIVSSLIEQGANIAFTYSSSASLANEIVKELNSSKNKCKAYQSDASVLVDCEKLVDDVLNDFGSIDVLINNAGITKDNLLMRMSEDDFEKVIKVNLNSVFNMTKACLRHFLKNRNGSIINMSSVVGVKGNAGQSNYAASKSGIIGFSKSLALEYAKKNININCVSPGFIETQMTDKIDPKFKELIISKIPSNRLGSPDDVANVTAFLSSDLANYITGETIHVNGGMYLG